MILTKITCRIHKISVNTFRLKPNNVTIPVGKSFYFLLNCRTIPWTLTSTYKNQFESIYMIRILFNKCEIGKGYTIKNTFSTTFINWKFVIVFDHDIMRCLRVKTSTLIELKASDPENSSLSAFA